MNFRTNVVVSIPVVAWGFFAGIFAVASAAATPGVVRGPYLQSGTSTNLLVRWRTDQAGVGRVSFGTNPAALNLFSDGSNSTTHHSVLLANLLPETVYYYSIGLSNLTLAGNASYHFRTAPPPGSRRPMRIWVLGDFGFTNASAGPVRNAYENFTTNRSTEVWLMLGDNAYHNGGDEVWQVGVFNTYSNLLRQSVVWSTIGNQETGGAATLSPTRPYLEAFSFPTSGEAGGVASGTEKYYSFDYGNAHFVCLDSMSSARTNGSPMHQWLEADLAANTNEWLIAFWHHPPYSKGSNDSDVRTEQIEMRNGFVPLLEAHGVDLVLGGHSHSYERSYLMDGHYGLSSNFTTNFLRNSGNGRLDGAGAYLKPTLGEGPRAGAVYAVTGSGAALGGGPLNHPAMYRSLNQLGSMVVDIHANRLEGKFLRETGVIDDYFTILKGTSALGITTVSVSSNQISLAWNAVADRRYRVEFSPKLPATEWTDLSGDIKANDITETWTGAVSGVATGGFYRVWSRND